MAAPVKRAMLIAGATASGKSQRALEIARENKGVIINADAMQVYRELAILTARPSAADEAVAPHRLYGHVPAAESYSVARWLADATAAMEAVWSAGRVPVVVGGTGLYFRALEEGLVAIPAIAPAIRERWRDEFLSKGSMHLHGVLEKLNQAEARRLNPGDGQRIVRALEVLEATGRSLEEWQEEAQLVAPMAGVAAQRILIEVPRAELYERAERRLDQMVATGALDEVKRLIALKLNPALPAMKAIGVPEFSAHLRGETSLAEALVSAKTATRHYIKRQLTWWRHQLPFWRDG
ncbi:MAG: tRNA (adenosine(37)-N6)-dimethylallyltransferase MiaA [Rhizobiales bacterium]|nr:tRNA (adenosine(37)-N6)-dimethylallyltransferase MiaA [Hyphomicrobiales bacterium]